MSYTHILILVAFYFISIFFNRFLGISYRDNFSCMNRVKTSFSPLFCFFPPFYLDVLLWLGLQLWCWIDIMRVVFLSFSLNLCETIHFFTLKYNSSFSFCFCFFLSDPHYQIKKIPFFSSFLRFYHEWISNVFSDMLILSWLYLVSYYSKVYWLAL